MTRLLHSQYSIGDNTALNRFKLKYGYEYQDWSAENITSRQRLLMDLAIDCWRFNDQRIDAYIVNNPHWTRKRIYAVKYPSSQSAPRNVMFTGAGVSTSKGSADYEWITFRERFTEQILLTDSCTEYWGQVKRFSLCGNNLLYRTK